MKQLMLVDDKTREIIKLHNGIVGNLKESLEMGIRLGELLTEQKQELKHGEFGGWIDANMPFSDRTARNYMKL